MIKYGLIVLVLALLTYTSAARGQVTPERFRALLKQYAELTDGDLAEIGKGEPVVKQLAAKDKNEVAVCGVIRARGDGDLTMARFAASLAQTNNKAILAKGKFSDPPKLQDLRELELDKSDIQDLKNCQIGNCKLNLSAAMIGRFQKEIDWSANTAEDDANRLFQELLFNYAADYARQGNDALLQYESRPRKLVLEDEARLLLDKAGLVNELAPEMITYLRDLPKGELSSMERSLDWSTVTFGLQPIIAITDTVRYTPTGGGAQHLIATRQVYASRYSDASIVFSMLVRTTAGETFIIFMNRSRSESLRGLFGGFKRSLAGTEAVTRVKDILTRARDRVESPADRSSSEERPIPMTGLDLILEWLNSTWTLVILAIIAILTVLVIRRVRSG